MARPKKSTIPEPKNAGDVANIAEQMDRTKKGTPTFVPPAYIRGQEDVETVLADTLDHLAKVFTQSAGLLREVLERRYISVEEAVALSEDLKKPIAHRRKRKSDGPPSVEQVRENFARLVAFQYDRAVALLDAYGAMHFNEIQTEQLGAFHDALREELTNFPEDYEKPPLRVDDDE